MHDIEPYYNWRDHYIATEDKKSPFYGVQHSELFFSKKVYNYFIHPQWDEFGSSTLYCKQIYADYETSSCIIELIGEWNDCLYNDILFLKQNVVDPLMRHGISKFIIICENVMNFHGSDECYYQEWYEDIFDHDGWVCFINMLPHVFDEMIKTGIADYIQISPLFNQIEWRKLDPEDMLKTMDSVLSKNNYIE